MRGRDILAWDDFALASPQASYYHLAAGGTSTARSYGLRPFALVAQGREAPSSACCRCVTCAWPSSSASDLAAGWDWPRPLGNAASALIEAAVALAQRDGHRILLRDSPDSSPGRRRLRLTPPAGARWSVMSRCARVYSPAQDIAVEGFSHDLRNPVQRRRFRLELGCRSTGRLVSGLCGDGAA
ncbi:hypothetical protein [Candidatus Amarolinea aalborgensis]|uniref:hypothetical protein n=1 Tax=Candidatus Amarolinea aalborgensis TaxID=2249329 RepID=UPI003BFA0A7F